MKYLLRILSYFVLVTIASSGSASQPDADSPSTLQLRATAQVDSSGVYLHQIIEGESCVPSPCRLLGAPTLGQTIELSRNQIAELARKLPSSVILTNWSGSEKVRVNRRLRPLEQVELSELLTTTLQREKVRDRGELELRLGRPWTVVSVPDETLAVKILELPVSGITPNFILRFEIKTENETIGTWQVPLQARVWKDVWVARSAQPRGRALADLDLTTERRDILTLRDALTTLNLNDAALELNETLAAGAPLLARSLRLTPVIQRGRVVDAVIQEGSLIITLKAEALEDGLPGQTIRVRNATSRREFRGKVQNEQTIIVTL